MQSFMKTTNSSCYEKYLAFEFLESRPTGEGLPRGSFISLDAKAYCRSVKSDGVSQSNINAKKLAAYSFYLPPIEEQTEIVRRVEELFAFADQIEQQVKAAQQRVNHLTQAILAKAFRGELTAQWREQNPDLISGENSAQALLAKIKAAQLKSNAAASKAKRPKQTSLAL